MLALKYEIVKQIHLKHVRRKLFLLITKRTKTMSRCAQNYLFLCFLLKHVHKLILKIQIILVTLVNDIINIFHDCLGEKKT